jgi:hypothetical protein
MRTARADRLFRGMWLAMVSGRMGEWRTGDDARLQRGAEIDQQIAAADQVELRERRVLVTSCGAKTLAWKIHEE